MNYYLFRAAISVAVVAAHGPASAKLSVLTVSGRVTDGFTGLASPFAPLPDGRIKVGDTFKVVARFDLDQAQLTSLFDADPAVNIYYLPGTQVSARFGSYATTFAPNFPMNSSAQLWNDRDVGGPVDAQSFSFFNYDRSRALPVPFALPAIGVLSENITFNAFDFSATARTNDLITQLPAFSGFNSKSFTYSISTFSLETFQLTSIVGVNGLVEQATIDFVPEPSQWAMLIVGFGAIGAFARRQKSKSLPTLLIV